MYLETTKGGQGGLPASSNVLTLSQLTASPYYSSSKPAPQSYPPIKVPSSSQLICTPSKPPESDGPAGQVQDTRGAMR